MHFPFGRVAIAAAAALLSATCSLSNAQSIVSGPNFSAATTQLDIPYQQGDVKYQIDETLIFDPTAGPMIKRFASPVNDQGQPLLLQSNQLAPLVIAENYTLPDTGDPTPRPVADWHEQIRTLGWVWVIPEPASNFPGLCPDGQSLITRDGQPWDWHFTGGVNGTILNVAFDPIEPDHVLDIHKALWWIGTETDTTWGDDTDETYIEVWEYPTPEPGTLVLAALGAALLVLLRRRLR